VGTLGDIAAFSTMSGKHHATGGQGGVVFTRNEDLYWAARRASDRGKPFGLTTHSNVTASLNLNLDDLAATVGRVQLRKLPGIVAGCRRVARAIDERCRGLKAVRVDMGLPDTEGAFWFLVFYLDLDQVTCDLAQFVAALQAEGLPFAGHYVDPFTRYDWYTNRSVFGSSGYPWTCPLYRGDPDRVFPLPNFDAVDARAFRIKVHENMTDREAEDIARGLHKVEAAFLK
jgi:dTDP-4-amino-4,6-dideoxygalactose transaminase